MCWTHDQSVWAIHMTDQAVWEYTVSRAEAIYHAIAGSGAEKSVNFLDVG
jgi:hypothetical protein